MNSNNFQIGDILYSTHRDLRKGYHPIIYLQPLSEREFIGGMISHSDINNNIKLSDNYLEEKDSLSNQYIVTSDNSFLVVAKLVKFESWGPFRKVGKLTNQGLGFVQKTLENCRTETFANYFRRMKKIT